MKELQMGCREIGVERGKVREAWRKARRKGREGGGKTGEEDEEERGARDRDAGQDKRMNAEGSNEEETRRWSERGEAQTGRGEGLEGLRGVTQERIVE